MEDENKLYCKNNIMWIVNMAAAGLERSRGNLESADRFAADANSLLHNHWDCRLTHWNNRDDGHLCGACIGEFPCPITPCTRIHPVNYPGIERVRAPIQTIHASNQPIRTTRQQFVPKIKVMMCKSALADEYGIEHPVDETRCTGVSADGRPCKFAHSHLDQISSPAQREFITRYKNGTLNIQKIMDEVIKVMTSCSPSEQKLIFDANTAFKFPSYERAFAKQWLLFWSVAASNARKNKPQNILRRSQMIHDLNIKEKDLQEIQSLNESEEDEITLLQLKSKIEVLERETLLLRSSLHNIEETIRNTNLLPLFDGENCMEEELVWELIRLFKICFSSYPMEEVKLGGKNNLRFPGPRDEDNTPDKRYQLQHTINDLNHQRDEIKGFSSQKAKLSELNEAIKVATKRLDSMSCIPICQGGAWCKYGVHVSSISSDGTLFVIDSENFNGEPTSNIPNIIEQRASLKKTIDSLTIERTYKQSLMNDNVTGINRNDIQIRLNEISGLLDDMRGKYMNMFNRILLFTPETPELLVRPYIAPVSTEAIILLTSSFLKLEKPAFVDQTMRDWYMKLFIFTEKIRNKKQKSANLIMIQAVRNLLSLREKKFSTIANSSSDDAITLYRNLIKNQHYIEFTGDLNTMKKRQFTSDGRSIFYISNDENDKNIYESDNYNVLRPCAKGTGLTTSKLKELVSSFDHNQFKIYFGSGAYTVMSFNTFATSNFMREAWNYFSNSNDSWKIFIEKVLVSNEEFESLGVIQEKIPQKITEGSYDSIPYILEERRVYCPEREKYGDDSWAYFFKLPQAKNPMIVGEDSKLAMEQPQLFQEFMNSKTTITFTKWLSASNLIDAAFDSRRKQISDAYNAYKSVEFSKFNWNTIFTFVNFIQNNDSSITIQFFSENEFLTKKWISSPASKNGVKLEVFLTHPFEYLEYYQHDFSFMQTDIPYTFEKFLEDKKEGWNLVRPKKMKNNKITSLAWASGDLVTLMAKEYAKTQLWNIKDLVDYNIVPTKFLVFSKNNNQFMIPRSICDDILMEIASALKPLNVTLLKESLDKLPKNLAEANIRLDLIISEYRVEISCKKKIAFDNFSKLVSNKFSEEELTNLTEVSISNIQEYISSCKKKDRRITLTNAFTSLVQLSSVDIESNINKIRSHLTTDVCSNFVENNGSMTELKIPNLIAIARNAINDDSDKIVIESDNSIITNNKKIKIVSDDDDSDDEVIIGKQIIVKRDGSSPDSISSRFYSSVEDSDEDDEDENENDENFIHPSEMMINPRASPLQEASRFPLRNNKKYFINRIEITKQRSGGPITQSYWAIGPFASKNDAKPLLSIIKKKVNSSGLTINEYTMDKYHQTTFEVLIPDKGMMNDKKSKKRNLSDESSSKMEQGVLDEISELIPIILTTLKITSKELRAPNLINE